MAIVSATFCSRPFGSFHCDFVAGSLFEPSSSAAAQSCECPRLLHPAEVQAHPHSLSGTVPGGGFSSSRPASIAARSPCTASMALAVLIPVIDWSWLSTFRRPSFSASSARRSRILTYPATISSSPGTRALPLSAWWVSRSSDPQRTSCRSAQPSVRS